jgi:hypothetical protein
MRKTLPTRFGVPILLCVSPAASDKLLGAPLAPVPTLGPARPRRMAGNRALQFAISGALLTATFAACSWRSPFRRHSSALLKLSISLGVFFSLSGCGGGDNSSQAAAPAPNAQTLAMQPVAQQTQEWCWAASAEMIFRYYGLPDLNGGGNYQCGIVAAYYGAIYPAYPQCLSDCSLCGNVAISTMDAEQALIAGYGVLANQINMPSRVLKSTILFSALSMSGVVSEISAGRPILAGITPNGFPFPDVSQHAVVVVGYNVSGSTPMLVVNDPFPYDAFPQMPNPYLQAGGNEVQAGRYSVPYASFVSPMNWANTLYGIQ